VQGTFVALRQRNFRIWMGAGFVSTTGSWMQTLAINWYVLQSTGSAARMGFTLLLQALPVLLLGSWAGSLADRLRGRRLLIVTQLSHASLAVGLAVVATGHFGILPVYLISLAGGLVNAIEGPAMGRFTSSTVSTDTLSNALSLGSLSNSAGRIIGMSLGGLAVAAVGPAPLFAINAASFLAVIGALLVIRTNETTTAPAEPGTGGVREGLRYLLRQPMVLIALGLAAVLGSLGRNYQITMAAMSKGPLHVGASGYGLLSTVFAIGTVLGGLAAARRAHLGYRTLVGAGLIASVLELSLGLVGGGVWAFGALLLPIAAGAVLIDTTVATRVQLDTRVEMRGRVLAALGMTSALSSALGGQALGWLCQATGPRGTLVLAGAVTTLACAAAGIAFAARQNQPLRPAQLARTLLAGVKHVPAAGTPRPTAPRRPARLVRPARLLRPARRAGPRVAARSAVHAPVATPVGQRVGAQP
jgi:MFS family permease